MADFSVYGQPETPYNLTPEQLAEVQKSLASLQNFDFTKMGTNPFAVPNLIGGSDPVGTNPYRVFTAPLSNKGNPTSKLGGNQLVVYENQPVRLVDNRTKQVVFEGTGYEAAQKAIEMGQNLSNTLGRKAAWDIQTLDPSSNSYVNVANEKKNKSTLGKIASVAGTALPIAMIPLTMGASAPLAGLGTAGTIGLGAGVGAASAGLRGQNILKGAVMGGLTSAGGQFLSGPLKGVGLGADAARAVGTGLGATAGGLATGQSLQNSLLGGVAAGGLTYLGGKVFDRGATTGGGETSGDVGGDVGNLGGDNIVVTAFRPGAGIVPSFFDSAQLNNEAVDQSPPRGAIGQSNVELDPSEIVVTGTRGGIPNFSGTAFSPSFFDSASDFAVKTEDQLRPADQDNLTDEEIFVNAQNNAGAVPGAVGGPDVDPEFPENIEVEAKRKTDTGAGTPPPTDLLDLIKDPEVKKELEEGRKDDDGKSTLSKIADYAQLAGLGIGLAGKVLGGGGSGAGAGRYFPGGKSLGSVFSAKLPTPGQNGAFTVGGLGGTAADRTFAARPVTDWYRYGMGPAMDIPSGTDLSRATSPYAGYGPGTLGEETFRAVSGASEEPTGMYAGGSMGYSRGSSRESFAVEGPGTGRSDDIPAVLSDGEYVIDAETVALLGDGSSKAGAKKLDELRVKVRKHKGKNLAKGKFSVNAKSPEKYMSGGRI